MLRTNAYLRSATLANLAVFLLLTSALGLNVYGALRYFPSAVNFDSLHIYIPYAQALIADKFAFFLDARSLRVAPMGYIYPALFGADTDAIKIGNTVLSCFLLLILYRLGSLLHSRNAGIAVAFLYALSPILTQYKPAILSEPLFFFLTGLWLMSVAEIIAGKRAFIPVAGIACGLMILTRGTYIYFLYATLFVTLLMCWKSEWRRTGQQLFAAHFTAIFFPLVVIVKNWLVFGYPAVATGTGAALYFGSHPLTAGYEAPYFSLGYDIGAVTQGVDYLSAAGDSLLKGVAIFMLKQRSLGDILAVYTQKAFAFVFLTKVILAETVWNLRSYRIAEFMLAMVGLLALRPVLMRWFIGGALAYQLIVHVPVLYTYRYSVGALEIPLTLLTAIGATHLFMGWQTRSRPVFKLAAMIIIIVAAIAMGEWHRTYSQALLPDILSVPHQIVHQWEEQELAALQGNGLIPEGRGVYRTTAKQWYLDVPVPELHLSRGEEYYVFSVEMTATTDSVVRGCGVGAVYFRTVGEPEFTEAKSRYFRIQADGLPHYYHLSASLGLSPLYPEKAGFLRISGNCPGNSRIQVNSLALSLSRVAQVYRKLYLEHLK